MPSRNEKTAQVIVVMGSARANGNTADAVAQLTQQLAPNVRVADLSRLTIEPFDYSRHDDRDDFQSVVQDMLQAKHIVFATPVYWYAMSGPMKSFFDRLTDLLVDPRNRSLGKALAGRNVWLLAVGTDEDLPPGFHEPFARTAEYLGMIWRESAYCRSTEEPPLPFENAAEIRRLTTAILG